MHCSLIYLPDNPPRTVRTNIGVVTAIRVFNKFQIPIELPISTIGTRDRFILVRESGLLCFIFSSMLRYDRYSECIHDYEYLVYRQRYLKYLTLSVRVQVVSRSREMVNAKRRENVNTTYKHRQSRIFI